MNNQQKRMVSVMFTGAGAPQASTLIRKLRNNGDCPCRLIALDMNKDVIGRYWADVFYQVPPAGAKGYVERIKEIIATEKPDALLNVSENDVPPLAAMRSEIEAMGTRFIGPSAEAVAILTNKRKLYERFRDVPGVRVPEYATPKTLQEFVDTAHAMGYPKRDLCFKPQQSKGTRGFRILTEKQSKRDLLLNQKPTARYMSLDEFISIFEGDPDFPQLLLMEVVAGEELDCMAVAYEGQALLCTVKSRESHRWGVIDRGELVRRPEIVTVMEKITENLSLSYNTLFQFIDGCLIEMGPRTSSYIFAGGFCEPWIAIKLGLGMVTSDEVRALRSKIPYGRRMLRYMEQIFIAPDGSSSD
jgi:carbamoylphosphate synthase large subunit